MTTDRYRDGHTLPPQFFPTTATTPGTIIPADQPVILNRVLEKCPHEGPLKQALDQVAALTAERDGLRKERDMWKANHDNQAELHRAIKDRPDLGDRAKRVQALIAERDRAVRALVRSGFVDQGAEEWTPPVNTEWAKEYHRAEKAEAEVARLRAELAELRSSPAYGDKAARAEVVRLRDCCARLEGDGSPEWTCSECGNREGFRTVQYDAGDFDMECIECGSRAVEESPSEALGRAIRDRDNLRTEAETAKGIAARLKKLVEGAYMEGFWSGADAVENTGKATSEDRDEAWTNSDARKRAGGGEGGI